MDLTTLPRELVYIGLIFVLFVLPKMLQRFRLPAAITSFALGAIAGAGFGLFQHDVTIELLSTLGIVGLFLYAGLEFDVELLQREAVVISGHFAVQLLLLAGVAWGSVELFGLDWRAASLMALATLTPSTGFILDSLRGFGLDESEQKWVKAKALGTELLALLGLFAILQSTTGTQLAVSSAVLVGMVVVLPVIFRAFAALVVPHAPRSEFAFMLMIGVVAAFATRQLGVYYLVGAFMVGVTARAFRKRLPALASEQMLFAVELFASFFMPFYFFHAGAVLDRGVFSLHALLLGLGLLAVLTPLRLASVVLHRRIALRETFGAGTRIAAPLLPTLVFGLVLTQILTERFGIAPQMTGGLIVYTVLCTLIPGLALRAPTVEWLPGPEPGESPENPPAGIASDAPLH